MKDYNRSLWLMLTSDKTNNNKIINFIAGIPLELRMQINLALEEYQNNNDKYKIEHNFYGECKDYGDRLYWYSLSNLDGVLWMGLSLKDYDSYRDFFQISIIPSSKHEYNELDFFDSVPLGSILYDFSLEENEGRIYLIDAKEVKFDLIKTPLGSLVEYNASDKKRFMFKNLKNIPENLNMFSFPQLRKFDCYKKRMRLKKEYLD